MYNMSKEDKKLLNYITSSWDKDTAYGKGIRWTLEVPSVDQCAVTAMVVQDYFGGYLLRCKCSDGDSHYWNRLTDGTEIDLTFSQFLHLGVTPHKSDYIVRERDYLESNEDTYSRYLILKNRVNGFILSEEKGDFSYGYNRHR